MIELFYFSSLDLMIKVEYVKPANTLRYASHREMKDRERMMAEQYIMAQMAPKTNYYRKRTSVFAYLGTDKRLAKKLSHFQRHAGRTVSPRQEQEIVDSVQNLINLSMRNYYTEKIGELIVSARNEIEGGRLYFAQRRNLERQMNDLLQAYNAYADHKITLDEIIPSELKPYWPGLAGAQCQVIPS